MILRPNLTISGSSRTCRLKQISIPNTLIIITTIINPGRSLHKLRLSLIPSVAQVVALNTNKRRLHLVIQSTTPFLTSVKTKIWLTQTQIFVWLRTKWTISFNLDPPKLRQRSTTKPRIPFTTSTPMLMLTSELPQRILWTLSRYSTTTGSSKMSSSIPTLIQTLKSTPILSPIQSAHQLVATNTYTKHQHLVIQSTTESPTTVRTTISKTSNTTWLSSNVIWNINSLWEPKHQRQNGTMMPRTQCMTSLPELMKTSEPLWRILQIPRKNRITNGWLMHEIQER